jgi:RNA polymerase sigma-70 factor (sigma-E family)
VAAASRDDMDGPQLVRPDTASGRGQPERFTLWAGEHYPSLLAFAELICGDASTAEDLVQIALARVYLRWERLSHPDQEPLAYVRRIVVNENVSLWRRGWKRRERSTAELPDTPTVVASSERADQTWAAVQALPRQQRAVVALRFYADLSVADTAVAMGCSTGTVKTHTSRALAALRTQLSGAST